MKITLIGVGLIGGSIALKLKEKGLVSYVYGVDKNENHLTEAKNLGIIDEIATLEHAVKNSNLIVFFTGLLCDLLWSDPDKDVQGWGENDRGVSFTFGPDVVSKFLNRHDLDLICRAHQVSLN